jgi:hypothetical protein
MGGFESPKESSHLTLQAFAPDSPLHGTQELDASQSCQSNLILSPCPLDALPKRDEFGEVSGETISGIR